VQFVKISYFLRATACSVSRDLGVRLSIFPSVDHTLRLYQNGAR